jgi:hypothetical protein
MPPPRRSLTKGNRLTRKVTSRSPILSWQLMGERGASGLYFPRRSLPRQCRGAAARMGHASTKNRGNTHPARPPPPVELPLQPPLPLGPVNRPEGGGHQSLDIGAFVATVLQAQMENQLAIAAASHNNVVAFHTMTAQASAASGWKDSHSCQTVHPPGLHGLNCPNVCTPASIQGNGDGRGDDQGGRTDTPSRTTTCAEHSPQVEHLGYTPPGADGKKT